MRDDLYDQMREQEGYYWWHVGKRKLVLRMLKEFFPIGEKKLPAKILDVGCGTGIMMQELRSYGKIWGLDVNDKALQYCRAKKAGDFLFKANLEQKLPFPEDFFDLVVCLDVLEHIKKDQFVLSETKRVLRNDGFLVVIVPSYQRFFSYWDKVAGHYRRYDRKYLKNSLQQAGFSIEKISYFNLFALLPAVIIRLIKSRFNLTAEKCSSDFIALPVWLNKFLLLLAGIERHVLSVINLPAGLSLFCLARREKSQ